MTPDDIFMVGVVLLGFGAVKFLLGAPIASYQAYKLVREERPDQWAARGSVSACWRIASLVLSLAKPDARGNVYSRRLSPGRLLARIALMELAIGLGMMAWGILR